MDNALKILMVEDAAADAELALFELERARIACVSRRVETREDFVRELRDFAPDVVLCDFTLPGFSGLAAVAIAKEMNPDTPCILVSGTVGEETAVESLKCGATDYVLKTNLTRLPSVVQRAVLEHKDRLARREAERALAASEERFRQLAENIGDVFWLTDPNTGRGLYVSPAYEQIWGRSRESLYASPEDWLEAVHPEDRSRVQEAALKMDTGGEYLQEYRITRPDGSTRWIRDRAFPVLDKQGGVIRIAGIAEDITERKRSEEEIRETRNFLTSVFDNIPNMIFVKDAEELRFVRLNPAGEKLIGYSEKDLLGKNDYDFFPKEQADFFVAKDRETLANRRQLFIVEETIKTRDGTERILQTKKLPILDKDGNPRYLLGFSEDITERKLAEQRLHESEAKYRQLIEQATDGIFLSDAEGNFILVNSRGCELLGYTQEELIGLNGSVTYLEEERERHADRVQRVKAGESLRFERTIRRKDGSTFPAEISMKMLDSGLIQVIFHDITTRREQERKIARSSRIHAVLSGINSAIVRIRDRQELFSEACRIAVEHGQFRMAWIGLVNPGTHTVRPVALAGFDDGFLQACNRFSTESGVFEGEGTIGRAMRAKAPIVVNDFEADPLIHFKKEHRERGYRSGVVLPLLVGGDAVGLLSLYASETHFFDEEEMKLLSELAGDISFGLEFIAKEEKVDYLAYYDTLTGLPNRSLLFDRLAHQLGTAKREKKNVGLLLIDLDRFRDVNETLGRAAGDVLLNAVATRLRNAVRDEDIVARVSADGFAMAVSGIANTADAARMMEARERACFGQPFMLGTEELRLSATAGIAIFPADGESPEALFANAEAALHKAKTENVRFLFYSPEISARVADTLRLESRLRRALDNGELVLWYQPKVAVRTRKLAGFEALMRWQDPQGGLVPPARFIPLMEQTGLILEAGRWALTQAAADCAQWKAQALIPPRIAVNVSALQLRQKDFVDSVVAAVDKIQTAGSMLELEITESTIMEDVEAIVPKLQVISGLGVEISIDDFGTGYSSLSYIARLPIRSLKIDRSFVTDMVSNTDSLAIVNSVISLAHSLRLNVIAEGVETEEQATRLLQLGCDELQGYLISKPVPREKVPELFGAKRR